MAENIFSHIESIEMRRDVHRAQLEKSEAELTKAKTLVQKAKIKHQIDYSKRQIAMIQKEWDFEDKSLREKHPDVFNISDDDLVKLLSE